jgi:hypothetical protein
MGYRIQFFVDGQRVLQDSIINFFSWYINIGIILDWYHLEKKCKEQLSLALKGRHIRNEILETLTDLLQCLVQNGSTAPVKPHGI